MNKNKGDLITDVLYALFVVALMLLISSVGVRAVDVACGDGQTIQSAIDALPSTGGILNLSDSCTYNVSTTILANKSNLTIQGSHTTVVNRTTVPLATFQIPDGLSLVNLTFQGFNVSTQSEVACGSSLPIFYLFNASNVTVQNIYGENTAYCDFFRMNKQSVTTNTSEYVWVLDNKVRGGIAGFDFTTYGYADRNSVSSCASGTGYAINTQRNSQYIYVRNNTLTNCGADGVIKLYSGSYFSIENNYLTIPTVSGDTGIYVGLGPSNSVIRNNTVIGSWVLGSVYVLSQFRMTNVSIINNIINNTGLQPSILVATHPNPSSNSNSWMNISNNVIYGGSDGILINDSVWDITLKNNIFSNNTNNGIWVVNDTFTTSLYNLFYGNTLTYNGTVLNKTGDLNTSNPLFCNAGANDFHLNSSATSGAYCGGSWVTSPNHSPAIDTGDPADSYSLEPAPNGNRINLGAFGNTIYASLSLGQNVSATLNLTNSTTYNVTTLGLNLTVDQNASVVLDTNRDLVGYWRFEGVNSTNNTPDLSSYNNFGTVVGGNTTPVTGRFGNALIFDGVNDYMNTGNSPSLRINGTALTMAGWFYFHDLSGAGIQQVMGMRYNTKYYYMAYNPPANNIRFAPAGSNVSSYAYISNPPPINTWVHIAGVFNGSVVSIYVNGTLINTTNWVGTVEDTGATANFTIGAIGDLVTQYFKGRIDEFAVWNRALPATEISALYNASKKDASSNLFNSINFTDPSTNNITLYSINTTGGTNLTQYTFNINTTVADNTPPQIVINTPTNTTTASDAFNFTYGEIVSWTGYSVDGGANTTNTSISTWAGTLSGLSDGSHNITVHANDTSGNMNSTTRYWTRDTAPPNLITNISNTTYSLSSHTIQINSTELGYVWHNHNGSGNSTPNSSNYTFSVSYSVDGLYNITIHGNDSINNYNTTTIYYTIDTTGPTVSITHPVNNSEYEESTSYAFPLYFNSTETISTCYRHLDGNTSNTTFTNGSTIDLVSNRVGWHNITIQCNDTSNNWGATSGMVFFLIKAKPTLIGGGGFGGGTGFNPKSIYTAISDEVTEVVSGVVPSGGVFPYGNVLLLMGLLVVVIFMAKQKRSTRKEPHEKMKALDKDLENAKRKVKRAMDVKD